MLFPDRQKVKLATYQDRHCIPVSAAVPCGSVQPGLIGISGVYLERMIRDSQTPGDNVGFFVSGIKPALCCEESIAPLSGGHWMQSPQKSAWMDGL